MRKSWGQIAAEAAAVLCGLAVAMWLCGCAYKGGKITEGVDFSAGVSIPGTEGAAEISFVNYLSGFRFGIDRNCGMECEYFGTNRFSFAWGLYESVNVKRFKATVSPCETAGTNKVEVVLGRVDSSDTPTAQPLNHLTTIPPNHNTAQEAQ